MWHDWDANTNVLNFQLVIWFGSIHHQTLFASSKSTLNTYTYITNIEKYYPITKYDL